jgi:hypothetical protein
MKTLAAFSVVSFPFSTKKWPVSFFSPQASQDYSRLSVERCDKISDSEAPFCRGRGL